MKKLVLVVSGMLFLGASAAATQEGGLTACLPSGPGLHGWTADGAALVFRGEELYDHINGGAEIFMEFGFIAAVAQDYVDAGGRKIVLEIYEMEDDAAAYGMFTYFQTPGGEALSLGDAGHLSDYYLILWKGRFLVNITAAGGAEVSSAGLRLLAHAVEKRLPGGGKLPGLASLLRASEPIPAGIDYFEGSLGFLNANPFFGSDTFGVRRGIQAAFSGGYDVFILEFGSPEESLERWSGARTHWEAREGFRDMSLEGERRFRSEKADGRTAVVSVVGSHIVGGVSRQGTESEAAMACSLDEVRRALEAAAAAPAGVRQTRTWRFGFSERVRYDTWDNVQTLDEEQYAGRADIFLRTRLSLDGTLSRGLELGISLTHEARNAVAPEGEGFQWDEVIIDRLFVRWPFSAGLPLTLTLGRQSLFFGEGFLVAEGTPLDTTRSDYFNAVRLDWTPAGGSRITLFACHQTEKDSLFPVIRDRRRPLVEQPETGLGLVLARDGKRREWEASVIYKKSAAGSVPLPEAGILAFDGRFTWKLLPETTLSGEAAFQTGTRGGARLSAWGANARLTWGSKDSLPLPLRISAEAVFLSGDDPSSEAYEGWVPLFSRWPRWSESYIHTLAVEHDGRTAWWSNLSSVIGELDVRLTEKLSLSFAAQRLTAPQPISGSWSLVSGQRRIRGTLMSARLEFALSDGLKGHLLYEGFKPGSFYDSSADGYSFLRFELRWAF